jgi:REP element-mobilizing transposase RayT
MFLELLGEVVERYEIAVHGFVLMPNHFHLIVESVRANLSKAMQNLQFRYSQEVNRAPGYDGGLFRGRFKNKLILEEEHFYYLLMYIHLNPVRGKLVNHPDQFLWSSHRAYEDEESCPWWLTTGEMKEYYDTEGGYASCLDAAMNGSWTRPFDFDSVLLEARRGGRQQLVKQPETKAGVTVSEALKQVVELTGSKKSEILSTKRGAGGNPARAIAIWWLVYGAGQTNSQVGEVLKISPSAVCKILKRIRTDPKQYFGCKISEWKRKLVDKYQ